MEHRSRRRERDSDKHASYCANGGRDSKRSRCHHTVWARISSAGVELEVIFLAGTISAALLGTFCRELTLSFRFTNPHVEIHWLVAFTARGPFWTRHVTDSCSLMVGNRQSMRFSDTKTVPISSKAIIPRFPGSMVQSGWFTCGIQLVRVIKRNGYLESGKKTIP
jgi:hypothetical protein